MCRFIVNWKITVLQLTVKLFHEISDLNIQRMYTILFSSSFKLLGCQLNANSSFRCRYFIGVDNIHLVTCGTYHIFCWVLRLELSAPRRVWCPPSCRWYHLITVSPWWPVLHSPELRPDCPLSAHVPPPPRPAGSRRPHLARPRPGGEMWTSWRGASLPNTCPDQGLPSGWLWGQDGQRFAIRRAKEFVTWWFVNVSSSFVRRIQKDFLHSSHWFLIFNVLYFQICKCKHYFRFKYLLKLVIFQMMPQWQWPTSSLYSWYSSAPSVSSTSRLL